MQQTPPQGGGACALAPHAASAGMHRYVCFLTVHACMLLRETPLTAVVEDQPLHPGSGLSKVLLRNPKHSEGILTGKNNPGGQILHPHPQCDPLSLSLSLSPFLSFSLVSSEQWKGLRIPHTHSMTRVVQMIGG